VHQIDAMEKHATEQSEENQCDAQHKRHRRQKIGSEAFHAGWDCTARFAGEPAATSATSATPVPHSGQRTGEARRS
jgi:hypothetical protein